jgi:aspartate/methionine/tyrosine aminotransferase
VITPSLRSEVPAFMVMDVMAAAARIEEAGGRVIHMEVGQPAAPAPTTAIEAARAALVSGRLSYTETLGIPALRARIARSYREHYGVEVDAQCVAVTTGSSAAFTLAFLALFEPGDRVAVALPGYPPYRHILSALGCRPALLETSEATRWAITPDMLIAEHRKTPLKGVLVASPANPTGTMMPAQGLRELIAAAESEAISFISDEIYHGLDYAFASETAAKFSDSALVINSFSKYFCMTGWRIGWMVVPPALIRAIERLQGNLAISVPALSQIAALAAFDGSAEMEAVKHGYEENRRILLGGLPKIGFDKILPVDGAFYLYADVSRFCSDSLEFAKRMLAQTHVAVTPGVDFDPLEGRRFIRICYAGSREEMQEALDRMGKWLS